MTIMAFGIPVTRTAVMLGAMTIHGIQSGPLFISQNRHRLWHLCGLHPGAPLHAADLHRADAADAAVTWCGWRCWRRSCSCSASSALALNNTMQSVYVRCCSARRLRAGQARLSAAPLILGLILGDQIEINLVRAIMTDANPWLFLTRPISGLLLLAAATSVGLAIWQHWRHQNRMAEEEPDF